MIVAIDGPAGAGKSSVAKRLADHLGFEFLDTGAMYRCVTLACMRKGISLDMESAVADMAEQIHMNWKDGRVWIDNRDVTNEIRSIEVTQAIRAVADNPLVRSRMVSLQQAWAKGKDVVTEGRDQGTVAFPKAEVKIYLTASPEERARRRVKQLEGMGQAADFDELLLLQKQRDANDMNRIIGALRKADEAIEICTDGHTEEEVLKVLIDIVQMKRGMGADA